MVSKIFAAIAFVTLMLIAFPLVSGIYTDNTTGVSLLVANETVGHPYAAIENLIWQNWYIIIFTAAGIGFLVWLFKPEG
jgi:hypothetical protein